MIDKSRLFFGTPPHKLHRKTSPLTSKLSAHKIKTESAEQLVYDFILSCGQNGCIAEDILDHFNQLPYSSVTSRPVALKRKDLIYETGATRRNKRGNLMKVLVATRFRDEDNK